MTKKDISPKAFIKNNGSEILGDISKGEAIIFADLDGDTQWTGVALLRDLGAVFIEIIDPREEYSGIKIDPNFLLSDPVYKSAKGDDRRYNFTTSPDQFAKSYRDIENFIVGITGLYDDNLDKAEPNSQLHISKDKLRDALCVVKPVIEHYNNISDSKWLLKNTLDAVEKDLGFEVKSKDLTLQKQL